MTQAAILAASGSPGTTTGFKNRIINGGMTISQYNGTNSVTPNNQYFLDRYQYQNSATGKLTFQQNAGSVTPPAGFANYMGITSSSAYTPTSGQQFCISQIIEGYNCADFAYGTASAQTITLSFWIRSSVAATFSGSVQIGDQSYSYPFNYTVNATNTWEQKSITIPGNTSVALPGTNNAGMRVFWDMGSGSTFKGTANSWQSGNFCGATGSSNVIGTNAATWYLTGVQLEVGTTATNFDFRSIGTELALCQRYFSTNFPLGTAPSEGATGYYKATLNTYSAADGYTSAVYYPVVMRAIPTITPYRPSQTPSGTNGQWAYYNGSWNSFTATQFDPSTTTLNAACYKSSAPFSSFAGYLVSGNWTASAEL